jgi:hypothetical protein
VPEFADVTIDDKVRTAIKLVIEPDGKGHPLPGARQIDSLAETTPS